MTNNHWIAAVHQVKQISNKKRISLVLFSGPNGNVTIEPYPNCKICNKDTFKYNKITTSEFIRNRMTQADTQSDGDTKKHTTGKTY